MSIRVFLRITMCREELFKVDGDNNNVIIMTSIVTVCRGLSITELHQI